MALKKNSPNIGSDITLFNEVPAFIKREAEPGVPTGGKDWIMFPDGMPPVSKIIGDEPIMVQSVEAEEPLTITPGDVKTWLTGSIEGGNLGFITGDELHNRLMDYVLKTTTINGYPLTGDITLSKGDIGLGNVDNTSDMDKPISNAVSNKFQELADTWGVDISQLKIEVNNIDQLLDATVEEVNRLAGIIDDFDNDLTDHLRDVNAHTNIRAINITTSTNRKFIPQVGALVDYVAGYIPGLPTFTIEEAGDKYFYILNGTTPMKIKETELMSFFSMNTIYPKIVNVPSEFPDTSTITKGTLVRIGDIDISTVTDPYTGYIAKTNEILLYNGTGYEHFGYSSQKTLLSFNNDENNVTLVYQNQDENVEVNLPIASTSKVGILSANDYNNIVSLKGLTRYGTPVDSWALSFGSDDSVKFQQKDGGSLDILWDYTDENPSEPVERSPYASVTLGNLTIKGDVIQEGSSYISEAETVKVSDNILTLNNGELGAGVTKGLSGVEVDRGTLPKYLFVFDESDDRFKVGTENDLWPVMLRDSDSNMINGNLLVWDGNSKIAKTNINLQTELAKYLPLAGGTMSGAIVFEANMPILFKDSNDSYQAFIAYGVDDPNRLTIYGNANYGEVLIHSHNSIIRETITNGVKNQFTVWDSGNQGHGSGLNADLLDGKHLSDIISEIGGECLPLTAGPTKALTGTLYAGGQEGTGAQGFGINIVAGDNSNSNNAIEIRAKDITMGFGVHSDGYGYYWIGGSDVASKTYFARINITLKSFEFFNRPIYNGNGLATLNEIPTSLPANGGNADTISNYPIANIMTHKGGTNNLNTIQGTSIYVWGGTNIPGSPGHDYGTVMQFGSVPDLVPGIQDHWLFQMAVATNSRIYVRQRVNTGLWEAWSALAYTSDIPAAPDLSGYIKGSKYDRTTIGPVSGFSSDSLITSNTLAFWDGSYNDSSHSNLKWCDRGRFGTIVTKAYTDYVDIVSAQTISGAKTFTSFVTCTNGAGTSSSSDMRFKNNIEELGCVLPMVLDAPTFLYNWKDTDIRAVGTSAQYWESLIPELVREADDEDKTKTLYYDKLTVILMRALKEEHNLREAEKAEYVNRLANLESRINMLEGLLRK